MKLLSLRLCEHDSNFSFFDGNKLHYFKSERKYQEKNHAYNDLYSWRKEVNDLFGVDYKDIDEIAVIFDPWRHNLPTDNENFFPAIEYDYFPFKKVYRVNHHYAHALSGWMILDKEPDIAIVIDGFGDKNKAWSIFSKDKIIKEGFLTENGSIGCEMANLGNWLGISKINDCEISGKVMGLQSYGIIDKGFLEILKNYDIFSVNSIFDLKNWIDYKNDETLARLNPLDWARTVHEYIGDALIDFFSSYANNNDLIFYSGGVAQNVIWNTKLKHKFPNLVIPPHCSDEGLSLGGIEWLRRKNKLEKFSMENFPFIQLDEDPNDCPSTDTIKQTARFLLDGKTVGWYQGNGEIGPRALGNRSILVNPFIKDAKNIVNKIKQRENYRPFGAVVLDEFKIQYFKNLNFENPYMLYVGEVIDNRLESITHVDNTCRIQTLKNENPNLKNLLTEFNKISGHPVLLNTSLNSAGKPIAGNTDDAMNLFKNSDLDILVIGNQIFKK
jgi:carbamoyltransferase